MRSSQTAPDSREPVRAWITVIAWCRRLHKTIKRFSATRAGVFVLYFVIFWITAAAAQSGFIGKWGLREDNPQQKFSIQRIFDGTASEPWAYRQLVPLIVNFADRYTPTPIRNRILHSEFNPSTVFVNAPLAADPQYGYRYILIYYINFFALLLSLFVLNRILVDWGMQEGTALVAPIIFVLATPFLQTKGGYFYDSTELFFFSAAFWLAMQGRIGLLILLTIPATLNKETFLIFLPTLYPILRRLTPARGALTGVGAAMVLSVAIDLTLKAIFASSPGSTVRFQAHSPAHALPYPEQLFPDGADLWRCRSAQAVHLHDRLHCARRLARLEVVQPGTEAAHLDRSGDQSPDVSAVRGARRIAQSQSALCRVRVLARSRFGRDRVSSGHAGATR